MCIRDRTCLPTYERGADGLKQIEPPERAIMRKFNRDTTRINEAADLEKKSYYCVGKVKSRKTVQMSFSDHNLRDPSEIAPLLHYLRDCLIYKYGGYHWRPAKDIGILHRHSWHVSFANNEPHLF